MMLNLAREFADRGTEVDLVLARREGAYLPMVPSSVPIVDLKARRTVHCIGRLAKYLRQEPLAGLLSTFMNLNVAALLARRLARVPTRIVIREANHASIKNATYHGPLMRLAEQLQPRVYGWADGIVAVSQGVADDMVRNIGVPAGRMHVINNPVVMPELPELAAASPEHPWFARGQPPVVLGVGRLNAQKDFPTLIRAFARARRRRPARLLILGEGRDRTMLESLRDEFGLQSEVDFPGFVLNPYAFLARVAVFVLSSRFEGSPNVLVEAMACGTPVVATDCPSGPRETLEEGRLGRLVPVGDADALGEAIVQTLDAPVAGELLRQKAQEFTAERAADQYLRVLFGDGVV